MKRFFKINAEPTIASTEAVVEITSELAPVFALELVLILHGLTDSVSVLGQRTAIVLTVGPGEKVSKAAVKRLSRDKIRFELGQNQAEYLLATLLRGYRDKMMEVDHVHVEGLEDEMPFDLTVMFDIYRDPMSAEDAAKAMLPDIPDQE